MKIIENLYCVQIEVDTVNSRVNFFNEFLKDKNIKEILFFYSFQGNRIRSPFISETLITQNTQFLNLSMFLNLTDQNNENVIKDLNFSNIAFNDSKNSIDFPINVILGSKIDFDKSFFNIKSLPLTKCTFLLFFHYGKKQLILNNVVNGSISLTHKVNNDIETIKLSDIINYTLKDKKIKRINYLGNSDGYLDLRGFDNRHIQNIPLNFLANLGSKEIYFEPFEIDFENSYLKIRDEFAVNENINLQFIY